MVKVFSLDEVFAKLKSHQPHQSNYFAMYSSVWDGIIRDPALMVVPLDDHIVHRGDGVFEAIKFVDGRIYALTPHLNRLESSMASIEMAKPKLPTSVKEIVIETVRASQQKEGIIRVFMSRGPGGFTTNPYESVGTQLYVVITKLRVPTEAALNSGVKVGMSRVPVKPGFFATVKSCNYLPNVMMKKEAIDAGLDYTVSLDERGFVAEGSTENIGCVTRDGDLVLPTFQRTLQGVTASRILQLGQKLVTEGVLRGISTRDLRVEELSEAREIHVYGTTIDVLPVGQFLQKKFDSFDVARRLRAMIIADLLNPSMSDAV